MIKDIVIQSKGNSATMWTGSLMNPGRGMKGIERTSGEFTSDDNARLFVYKWKPAAAPRGIIHIAHGLGEHAGRYDRTARVLAAAGFLVYAHDHRGHGRTAGSPRDLGLFARAGGWNRVVEDLRRLIAAEKREAPNLPLILLGHSMGSFMAQQFLYEHGELIEGCILSGSSGKPGIQAQFLRALVCLERLRLGPMGKSRFLYRVSLRMANRGFQPARTPFDWLTRDEAEINRLMTDPCCNFIPTVQLWMDLINGINQISRPENQGRIPKSLPVYIFSGTHDPVSNGCRWLDRLLADYARAGLRNVRHRFYPEGRHEMLNEINREEVLRDLLLWLEAVVGKSQSN
jgi:alpha-beta hydrolase superfamily lysophospholipase